eukprot:1679807-Rhodomonas_salina.5
MIMIYTFPDQRLAQSPHSHSARHGGCVYVVGRVSKTRKATESGSGNAPQTLADTPGPRMQRAVL